MSLCLFFFRLLSPHEPNALNRLVPVRRLSDPNMSKISNNLPRKACVSVNKWIFSNRKRNLLGGKCLTKVINFNAPLKKLQTCSSLHLRGKGRHNSTFHNILHTLWRTGSNWTVVSPGWRQSDWWPTAQIDWPGYGDCRNGQRSFKPSRGRGSNDSGRLVIGLCSRWNYHNEKLRCQDYFYM